MLVCVWVFGLLHLLWHAFMLLLDPFAFMTTQPRPASKSANAFKPAIVMQSVTLKSHMTRYDPIYHLVLVESNGQTPYIFSLRHTFNWIRCAFTFSPTRLFLTSSNLVDRGKGSDCKPTNTNRRHVSQRTAHLAIDIQEYFEADGILCREKFEIKLCEMYNRFIIKHHETTDKKKQ